MTSPFLNFLVVFTTSRSPQRKLWFTVFGNSPRLETNTAGVQPWALGCERQRYDFAVCVALCLEYICTCTLISRCVMLMMVRAIVSHHLNLRLAACGQLEDLSRRHPKRGALHLGHLESPAWKKGGGGAHMLMCWAWTLSWTGLLEQ